MSKQVVQYEERYVAFLDILGFRDMAYQASEDQGVRKRIDRALKYNDKVQRKNNEGERSVEELGRQVSVLSDSIVISYEMKRPITAFCVLLDLVSVCNDLLGEGIMVRGGVSVGKLVHDRSRCFGPALIDAYLMESDLAIYPRVIVKKSVLEHSMNFTNDSEAEEMEYFLKLLDIDADGEVYLDYLGQTGEFDNQEVYKSYMSSVRKFILCAKDLYTNKQRTDRKYRWFQTYFNRTIEKFDGLGEALRV